SQSLPEKEGVAENVAAREYRCPIDPTFPPTISLDSDTLLRPRLDFHRSHRPNVQASPQFHRPWDGRVGREVGSIGGRVDPKEAGAKMASQSPKGKPQSKHRG